MSYLNIAEIPVLHSTLLLVLFLDESAQMELKFQATLSAGSSRATSLEM